MFIVTLETKNFSFEAHGYTEEEANEAMGVALNVHRDQYGLHDEWWSEYDFQTHRFEPGLCFRNGERLA
jgi:hypothetical protein